MKETKSINIAGRPFIIDEDAYQLFYNYVEDIRSRLPKDQVDDVLDDLEARACEVFLKIFFAHHKEIIDKDMVNNFIEQMGKPEEFGEEKHPFAKAMKIKTPSPWPRIGKIVLIVLLSAPILFVLFPALIIFLIVMGAVSCYPWIIITDFEDLAPYATNLSEVDLPIFQFMSLAFLGVVIIGIPIFVIIYSIIKYMKTRNFPQTRFWVLTVSLWLLSIIGSIPLLAKTITIISDGIVVEKSDEDNISSKDLESRFEDLKDFHSIKISGGMDVEITQSDKFSVEIRSNQLQKIKSSIKEGVLIIEPTKTGKNFKGFAYISAPKFETITLNGACDLKTTNTLVQPSLGLGLSGASDAVISTNNQSMSVVLSGSSDLDLKGEIASLYATCSGASDMDCFGSIQKAHLVLSGSSDFDGKKCEMETCTVVASGSSDAAVNVKNTLSVTASGSSEITYYGNPKVEKNSISGSSSIIQKSK